MEIDLFVSEKDLEEFPEEAPDSTGEQEQSSLTSQTQGTVKSILSVDTSPTPDLLDRIRKGEVAHIAGYCPSIIGGSIKRGFRKGKRPTHWFSKQPQSLVIPIQAKGLQVTRSFDIKQSTPTTEAAQTHL